MSTPINEKDQMSFPAFQPNNPPHSSQTNDRSSDEDGTLRDNQSDHRGNFLRVTTSHSKDDDRFLMREHNILSPTAQREADQRLGDELNLQQIEKQVSEFERLELNKDKSGRSRSRNPVGEPIDDFDADTNPIHESTKVYKPVENPSTNFAKVFKRIHNSVWLVRYFFYIAPFAIILLIPLMVGKFAFPNAHVGGVELFWFGIWLEIVWLSLWAARIIAKCIPYPMGIISSAFTNNNKKWRDLGIALEIPATFFFWGLAIEVSFLPTMRTHIIPGYTGSLNWQTICNKIIIAFFVGCVLNFFEKIIIQLIAISFHLRTYADRIDINRFQISSLVKLYVYSREKLSIEDSEFELDGGPSGARTPMAYAMKAQKNARAAFTKVGDVAGKVAGDFTGKQVTASTHPSQVVLTLLRTNPGAQILARRLYRTFVHEDAEHVLSDDLKPAFDNDDEANAAFTMFDKDLNGDISMEELEAVCVEIGRERKAITASLKDLDSVVSKLNSVFVFIVCVIVILVFVSIISTSASGVLTSLGSSVLALSWLFSATAQEFLQSIIFVFVKHPFDVGDRVTIYGNTGADMKGDDYFVKEIALLYTEFKKMEGHVVQAPNSYLNTLFILNQRRSGGLAEAVPVTVKFGTTLEQIDSLRLRLLEFVGSEKREYQKNILTELRQVYECHSITLNVVFFYKSNWQNELLRLQRRNKFICALMVTMNELGIEGPRMRLAGANPQYPMHLHNAHTGQTSTFPTYQTPSAPEGQEHVVPDSSNADASGNGILRRPTGDTSMHRQRGESISAMGKRVDFSLGMSSVSAGDAFDDVFDEPTRQRLPQITMTSASPRPGSREQSRNSDDHHSLAHTTSRESAGSKLHKNRFFSRKGRSTTRDDGSHGVSLDDLEAGHNSRNRQVSVFDMPDIPEASGANSAAFMTPPPGVVNQPTPAVSISRASTMPARGVEVLGGRMDPRTGIISPQAVARDSALERGELPRH